MAKSKSRAEEATGANELATGFPIPFTISEFKKDITVVYLHKLRELAWMTGSADAKEVSVWKVIGKQPADQIDIYNPDASSDDMGIGWDDIKHTDFANYLLSMYEYGCHGVYEGSLEPMEDGTCYTWLSAILVDMEGSRFLEEWSGGYSGEGRESVKRCHYIARLANARCTLESGHPFSFELGGDDGQLTVHQLALLAGMEELSIRAAANPNRPNPLPIIEEEKREKRTRFALDVAKAWLESKGRYVPVRVRYKGGDIDLATRKFSSIDELLYLIEERKRFLSIESQRPEGIEKHASALAAKYGFEDLSRAELRDPALVRELAEILEFPAELFGLRVRETLVNSELAAIRRQLHDLGQPAE